MAMVILNFRGRYVGPYMGSKSWTASPATCVFLSSSSVSQISWYAVVAGRRWSLIFLEQAYTSRWYLDCDGIGLHMTLRFTSPHAAMVVMSARLIACMAGFSFPFTPPGSLQRIMNE